MRLEREEVWSRWWRLQRQAERGSIDPFAKRDLLDTRTKLDRLDRALMPELRSPGPYRDPVDGSILLESPKNPILGR